MAKCVNHPARKAAIKRGNGKSYCQEEKDEQAGAARSVDKHVSPKECFIWFTGSKSGWTAIPGAGCAHWIAHQKRIRKSGATACVEGFAIRVRDVLSGRSQIDVSKVKVGSVWANVGKTHCGIVSKIKPGAGEPKIEITHCSSRRGRVARDDWASYFKGGGKFYKG